MIFDIQHYAVHDGPGIRTLVFLKGCPLRCAWCCNPESQSPGVELRHSAFHCRGCLRCREACEKKAVTADLSFDRSLCLDCREKLCVEACDFSALARVGREMTVEEIVEIVSLDIPFYRNSGGGVTFSGGEPFFQPAFLLELLKECKRRGIHTAVETCGFAREEDLFSFLPLVDLFLFDLKIADPFEHFRLTGVSNELILKNLEIVAKSSPLLLRLPLIPGGTDSEENLSSIAEQAKSLGITSVCLEPYHSLGVEKYREFGRECPFDPLPIEKEALERAWGIFER
ncbi:MAG TPA: glycyl-radical enzyme activating protein, partial [Chroococcales cyanobacterium]